MRNTEYIKEVSINENVQKLPKLKGRTKIELFNAKTGEKTHEQEDNNLVTNALLNLVNLPSVFTALDYQSQTKSLLDLHMPFYSKSLSGLMVFSSPIEEDVDNISPSFAELDENVVGYAGDAYSGTNPMRGTLNLNESMEIANGYRYVWDFATDKANGKISCACLVPKILGNMGQTTENYLSGFGFSVMDYVGYNTGNGQVAITKFVARIGQYNSENGGGLRQYVVGSLLPCYAEAVEGKIKLYAVSPKLGHIYVFLLLNPSSLSIMKSPSTLDLRNDYSILYTNPNPTTHNAEYYDGFLYLWTCNVANSSVLKKINLSGTVVEEKTINFDSNIDIGDNYRVFDPQTGFWYGRSTTSSVKVFNKVGKLVQTYSTSTSFCVSIIRLKNRKYLHINASTSYGSIYYATYLCIGDDGLIIGSMRGSSLSAGNYSDYYSHTKQVHGFDVNYPYFVQGASFSNSYTSTNALVWFGITWSLELYQQTNARLWRQGQTAETVVITHIITKGTIDERIIKALKTKDTSQAALIDAVKAEF